MHVLPANPNPCDTHLHATLQRIDQLANQDVEMTAPLSESSTFLILDTNILLHHFDVLSQFVDDAEKHSLPIVVVIPGVVVYELDGQKNRDGLAWFARRASTWLLEKIKERRMVKGQANEETCKRSGNWKIRVPGEVFERMNDALILDCCLYFGRSRRTFICSADKNLCIESTTAGIPTLSPTRNWSSREIAWTIFREYGIIDVNHFGSYKVSYRDPKTNAAAQPSAPTTDSDDMMIVDDDESVAEVPQPSHALDLLHLQVIDHFTRLLIELVGRVGGPEIHNCKYGAAASQYAPQWQKSGRPYTGWTLQEIWEYLEEKRKTSTTSPRIDIFLSKPYSCRGARRGQDWSRRDWDVALMGLARFAEVWEEDSIGESLGVLEPHVEGIFAMRMRPTGTSTF
ncbi:Transcriptional protein swt1 [Termitomyces sp. T112]|nr:Transcriptional protein swt1 [Termitomyces sp. T112]